MFIAALMFSYNLWGRYIVDDLSRWIVGFFTVVSIILFVVFFELDCHIYKKTTGLRNTKGVILKAWLSMISIGISVLLCSSVLIIYWLLNFYLSSEVFDILELAEDECGYAGGVFYEGSFHKAPCYELEDGQDIYLVNGRLGGLVFKFR
ncbi:hypothetical protein [Agarivorans litoreus]|uniref:hypothetical protein n=1 Tax=Agarivorans litoreus TaxID=1510455 RepID=UPI001C7DD5C6|nr:hypothetical protein [Agarivorans litoreus]